MLEKYKRILVINTYGIGDVLFSTPMLRALKENIPNANIDFICNDRCRYLLYHNRNIDNIIVFEKDHFRELFKESILKFAIALFRLIRKIKARRYDLVVDLSMGHRISLLLMLLGIKKRIGFNYKGRGRFLSDKLSIDGFHDKHVAEYYLELLEFLGIENVSDKNFELVLSKKYEEWAGNFIRKNNIEAKRLVGIGPGGGKSWGEYAVYRRWSPENFSYVARELVKKEKNLFFLIIGSKEEEELSRQIREALGSDCIPLCGRLTLPESISLIKRCELLYCNDGGLLHIAVSQGIKTVSIFGPVDDKVYGPYPLSDKHKVVRAEKVECRPCYRNFKHKACQSHDCLMAIDKEMVLAFAEEGLGL